MGIHTANRPFDVGRRERFRGSMHRRVLDMLCRVRSGITMSPNKADRSEVWE
jgi:hypothetical protein